MEFSSKDSGRQPEVVAHPSMVEVQMTDAAFAQDLIQEAFPVRRGRNAKSAIGEVFDALRRRERSLPRSVLSDRPRQWTERRVKALWHREARRVDHYEIQDLTAVAVEEARNERQRLRAREARLASFLASHSAGEDQQVDQRVGGVARGLDHAGVGGTEADADFDQRNGWGR